MACGMWISVRKAPGLCILMGKPEVNNLVSISLSQAAYSNIFLQQAG
jgi:hypothetical protein